jgi:holliday junction DNA helicase RuvA
MDPICTVRNPEFRMFSYISGTLVSKRPTDAVIDVQGVGYAFSIPASSFDALPDVGGLARLYVHLYVREDAFHLFGFASEAERSIFEIMLSVTGVGPRLALAALSSMRAWELRDVILAGDTASLMRIPGVGRKTAERLTIELRDRLGRMDPGNLTAAGREKPVVSGSEQAREDAVRALESLGLVRAVAERTVRKVLQSNHGPLTAEEMVRLALREA